MTIQAKNLDSLISKLKSYQNSLKEKQRRLLEKLAEIGINKADVVFKTAEYDGQSDVEVQKTPQWVNNNTLLVTATGAKLLFIEFGTGAQATEGMRGTYGQGKGNWDKWGYYGDPGPTGTGQLVHTPRGDVTVTKGNPPARAMYQASKEMREKILDVAREVFNND